jgi:glycosyltransferase involved in cell wall biosynthesis
MLAARRAGIPYVVTFHTGGHSSGFRHRLRGLQWRAIRPLLAHAARLIGVSRFEADLFRKQLHLDPRRFAVIPNGSNLPAIEEQRTEADGTLIVSVGRLERYKGHHRVIAALPHVIEKRPNVRLRIVGTGPYERALRLMAEELGVSDRVEIGSVSASDRLGMSSVLSRASLVTLMSQYEAHPIAVMEALSLKRPVLAADTSGLRELAGKGLIAAIPLESTPEQLAGAILSQLDGSVKSPDIELPTWDECAATLLAQYESVIQKAGKKPCA